MSRSLVIVESPAKAKTINHYLGSGYIVKASMGHVRDLPKSKMGVDVEHDFAPTYQVIPDKKKVVAELKKLAAESESIILAADNDREGEAISWHLRELIGAENPKIFRAVFNEITEDGIKKAFAHLGGLDMPKIEAQQTRRILDRLVGYLISPLLWKKIGRGLSAGRVQSVALRLICDREKEIRAFVPEEFWNVSARLRAANPPEFKAALAKIDGKKAKVANKEQADAILEACRKAPFVLDKIKVEEKRKTPLPPYITSSLQQDAFRLLHYPVKKTMFVAQKLYEGLAIGELGQTGLITYMRTDSFRIADEARAAARSYIERTWSPAYVPSKPNAYKNKKKAQDAHEAVRPAHLDLPPDKVKEFLKKEEYDLYKLVWNRFIASQMAPAVIEETDFDIRSANYLFKAKTLVKELEAKGIGRPSTYAPIIATLQNRVYVSRDKGKFIPTDLGMVVTEFLVTHFPALLDVTFTARMEEELDQIGDGERAWLDSLREYYAGFGRFKACSGYPECTHKEALVKKETKPLDEKCPQCGAPLVIKFGRFGSFVACSSYPKCKYIQKDKVDTGIACPEACGGTLVRRKTRRGKYFFGCSLYPKCKYATWDEPVAKACPLCGRASILKKNSVKGDPYLYCPNEKCTYKEIVPREKLWEQDKEGPSGPPADEKSD
ncbi:MAG: topoisomerase [Candidatus Aminicenantes bacterium]|nr:topoisomerase [Candidatus Aminicenantes bacterium]